MYKEYSIYIQIENDFTTGIWLKVDKITFIQFIKEIRKKEANIKIENTENYKWYIINGITRAAEREVIKK